MKRHSAAPWTAALYVVTPAMVKRMRAGSVHHAVVSNEDPENPSGCLLALCGDEPGTDSLSARDATLMAAAPEMLEALKAIQAVSCDPDGVVCVSGSDGDRQVIADALKVIAKAEGRGE